MSRPGPNPPAVATALLSWCLPPGAVQETLLGDLHELFLERCGHSEVERRRAGRWYAAQAVRLSLSFLWRRIQGRRLPELEPHKQAARSRGDGMWGLLRLVRLSFRSLTRSPGFTVPVVLILAVGMTAAIATFTVVDSIVFRPLDIPESHRVVIVCEDHVRLRGACIASPANTADLGREATTLSDLGIGRGWPFALTDKAGSTGVRGGLATAGFLRALGVGPAAGRLFLDDEYGPDRDKVVILSHEFWVTRYGDDPEVLGTVLRLDGLPHEIVGVLPTGFEVPFDLGGIQIWKPPHFDPLDPGVRGWRGFRAIGRLANDASVAAASAELTSLYARLAERHDEVSDEWRLRVQPLLRVVVGDTRVVLFAFLGAAGVLLLIVCANSANLLLARGLERRDEFAVRAALGARRSRLVGEMLVESAVLAGTASMLAFVLTAGTTRLILRYAPPEIPRLHEVSMDARILIFSAALAVLVTVLFGVLPALRVTSWNPGHVGRSSAARGSRRVQNTLVMAEIALCGVLLSSAGVLTRSFMRYLDWDPGFELGGLLAVSAFVDTGRYSTREELRTFYDQAERSLEAVPGVRSAASASAGPLFGGGDGATSFVPGGEGETGAPGSVRWFDVGPGYFRTLGLPLVQGRAFTALDEPGSALVAVVNEALVRSAWSDGNAVGKLLTLPELERSFEIIGVVTDVDPLTPGAEPYPEIYWSNRQLMRPATFFITRVSGGTGSVSQEVVDALQEIDPSVSLGTPQFLREAAARSLVRPRFQAAMLLVLAAVALILSAVGVYAVVSYAVSARTRELGIRMALGAPRAEIVALVIRSSAANAAAGVVLGLAGSLVVAQLIRGLVHGVSPIDPVSMVGAGIVLTVATGLATLMPVRRALRADLRSAVQGDRPQLC